MASPQKVKIKKKDEGAQYDFYPVGLATMQLIVQDFKRKGAGANGGKLKKGTIQLT